MNKIIWGFLSLALGLAGMFFIDYIIPDFLVQQAQNHVAYSFIVIYGTFALFLLLSIFGAVIMSGWRGVQAGFVFFFIAYLLALFTSLGDWALWIMILPIGYVIAKGIQNLKNPTSIKGY